MIRHQTEGYLAAGMNGFVAKPIEAAALERALPVANERGEVRGLIR